MLEFMLFASVVLLPGVFSILYCGMCLAVLQCLLRAAVLEGGDRRSRLLADGGPLRSVAEEDAPRRQQPARVHAQLEAS